MEILSNNKTVTMIYKSNPNPQILGRGGVKIKKSEQKLRIIFKLAIDKWKEMR